MNEDVDTYSFSQTTRVEKTTKVDNDTQGTVEPTKHSAK